MRGKEDPEGSREDSTRRQIGMKRAERMQGKKGKAEGDRRQKRKGKKEQARRL